MTKLTPEAKALVSKAGAAWARHKFLRIAAVTEIRAKIEAEYAEVERRSALDVSEAIRIALEGGATQSALREVTSKDQRTFQRFRLFDGLGPLP
ncbi:hypothetical protein [Microcella sp.]|uniref:hypothetical protein n=1 Tax=Microcella sp. TaxID=1913979 RepID=UPI00391C7D3E